MHWQKFWLDLCTKQVVSARARANQFLPCSSSGIAIFGMRTVQADSCLNSDQIDTLFISVGGQEGGLFRVKPYPLKQKNRGLNSSPQRTSVCACLLVVGGPVCWAKMVHFWKPWKHAFWPPPECQGPLSMVPKHSLSSIMV